MLRTFLLIVGWLYALPATFGVADAENEEQIRNHHIPTALAEATPQGLYHLCVAISTHLTASAFFLGLHPGPVIL